MNFIRLRRVERFGHRDLQDVAVQRDRHAAIHPRDVCRNGLEQLGRNFPVAQRDHLRAEIVRLDVQNVIQLHDAEVLQDLDRGRVAALHLGDDILVLKIVQAPLLLDERQQWI